LSPSPEKESGLSENLSDYFTIKPMKEFSKTITSIGLTMDNFPLLDGATSTQPVRSLIACEALNFECYWYEAEGREMFLRADLYKAGVTSYEEQQEIRAKLEKNSKTHDAYLNLINKKNDLILVSTKPSDDELREAKKQGVKLELTPVGLDGFVFLVNEKNPIQNLNANDIVGIYSGKIKRWTEVEGADPSIWDKLTGIFSSITAFTRPVNSGSQELMEKLVMKGVSMDKNLKEERIIMAMAPLIEGVEENENSIGYSLYYYKNNMIDKRDRRPNVKLISVNGIEPNPENISSKKYSYVFDVYAVTREDEPKSSLSYQIKEWLTSEEGQEVIKKAGYVSLSN
jgi:phosphate transport system substrate-binding protein